MNKYASKYMDFSKKFSKKFGEHAANFNVGAGKTMMEMGLTAIKGFGHLSNMAAGLTTKNTKAGDYLIKKSNQGLSALNNNAGISKRVNTPAGAIGSFVGASLPIGRAVSAPAKLWAKSRALKRAKEAAALAKHNNRVSGGVKAAETYKSSLPKTAPTIGSPSRPIYPSRVKYNTIEEYTKQQSKKKKLPYKTGK